MVLCSFLPVRQKRIKTADKKGKEGLDSYDANAPLNDREGKKIYIWGVESGEEGLDCHAALAMTDRV
ncbi:MAG: hypothetical protein LBS99_04455 [Clostridiales bacterium]|jgi:hypothetical protein|nr:hypothetical protein [Clostridiales bacterium]